MEGDAENRETYSRQVLDFFSTYQVDRYAKEVAIRNPDLFRKTWPDSPRRHVSDSVLIKTPMPSNLPKQVNNDMLQLRRYMSTSGVGKDVLNELTWIRASSRERATELKTRREKRGGGEGLVKKPPIPRAAYQRRQIPQRRRVGGSIRGQRGDDGEKSKKGWRYDLSHRSGGKNVPEYGQ